MQPRLLQVREWLRAQGFRQAQALKAEIGGGVYLRVSVYQDAEATVRVQVTFHPAGQRRDLGVLRGSRRSRRTAAAT